MKKTNEIQSMCDVAMETLMQQESFNKKDFYDHLRGNGLSAHQIIDLCKAAFREHLAVGYIERWNNRYRKAERR